MSQRKKWTWDALNRMTSINWIGNDGAVAQSITEALVYDVAGNITTVMREMGVFTFTHDATDQLTTMNGPAALGSLIDNRTWSFDGTGNRINDSILGAGSSVNNVITQLGGHNYTADASGWGNITRISGNQNSIGDRRFTYRADGQITAFTKSIGNGGSQIDTSAIYAVDALGRRTAKSVTINSGATIKQSFAFMGDEDKILLGRKGNGVVQLFIDGAGMDEHLAQIDVAGVRVYVTDHLGSVLNSAAAGSGNVYSPWGEVLVAAPVLTDGSDAVVYGLAGGTYNIESGTITFGVREYDPVLGRWLSADPIGFAGGDVNLYAYVWNNPLKYTDPNGLAGIIAGSGGAAGGGQGEGLVFEASGGIAIGTEGGSFGAAGFASTGSGTAIGGGVLAAGPLFGIFYGDISSLSGPGSSTTITTPAFSISFLSNSEGSIGIVFGKGGIGRGLAIFETQTQTQVGGVNGNGLFSNGPINACGR